MLQTAIVGLRVRGQGLMRVMFLAYLLVVCVGLAYFLILGLRHA